MSVSYSAADIIVKLLKDLSLVQDPDTSGVVTPCWINFLPDQPDVFDRAVAVNDTTGLKEGRLMIGTNILRYGVQIVVREATHRAGWTLCAAIEAALELIAGDIVYIGSSSDPSFTVHNVSQTSPILFLGLEQGSSKRRKMFTINYLVSITED